MSKVGNHPKRRRKNTKSKQRVFVQALDRVDIEANQRKWNDKHLDKQANVKQSLLTPTVKSSASEVTYVDEPMPQEPMDWRLTIQDYITHYNKAETDQRSSRLEFFTEDPLFSERLTKRLARVRERDMLRAAEVTGSELKAEVLEVNEFDYEMIVYLRLHIKRKIKQEDQHYIEERVDLERIWLRQEDGTWIISRIEAITPERKPRYSITASDWSGVEEVEEERKIVKPYLNPNIITSFRPSTYTKRYSREQAVAYADQYWNKPNPKYEEFEANCTNYVSQCIFAGEAPMLYTNRRDSGWWYKGKVDKGKEWWSYSWAVSRSLAAFLSKPRQTGFRAVEVKSADQLELGDIIVYDWNGNNTFQHTTIVTAFDSKGQPLVNANTTASRHRYWDYQDSYAWTPNTRYRFFHISDNL